MKKQAKKSPSRRWEDHVWAKSDSILHARLSSRELLVNVRVCAAAAEKTMSAWVSRVLHEAVEREFPRPGAKRVADPQAPSCRTPVCPEPYYAYGSEFYCEKHYPLSKFQQSGRRGAK